MNTPVDLAAAIRLLPNHDQVPDLTGGLGSTINDSGQSLADALIRAIVNGINLTGLAQAAGVDPKSLLTTLLADLPANLLPGILASLSLDIPILGTALKQLTGGDLALLTTILNLLPISEVTDRTLTGLLAVLGLDLSDPLNLAGLAVPGLNVITAGPTFTALKMLGLDLGWLPSTPNGVANEINNTPYLRLGVDGVLDLVLGKLQESTLPGALAFIAPLVALITDPATSQLPDVIDLRVIPTVGIGAGAFAAAMAYQQVIDQLKFQPGGSAYVGTDALLGSLTLLPMILINNPGRPDGGAFARFGSLAALFGIDTVNPRTELTGDGGLPALDPLGLHVGGANVLPILIDATYEYQPLSDLASWPNPFTLANNLAAGLLPTYMLRGLGLDGLTDQLLPQVTDALGNVGTGKPLALNLYLTLHSATSPMLEPLYLAADFLNLIGLSPLAQIPMRLANALAPAVNTLTNIGYANVVQNPDGTYTRDFSNAGTETPFLSFADIDYGRVPGDVINQLIGGFTKEFFSANPTPNGPNALANLLDALLGGGLGGILPGSTPAPGGTPATDPLGALLGGLGGLLSGLGGILGGLLGGGTAQLASTGATARSIPDPNPSFSRLSISGGAEDESATAAVDSETAIEATEDATAKPASSEEVVVEKPAVEAVVVEKPAVEAVVVEKPATEEPAAGKPADEGATGPKHAKPDEEPAAGKPAATDSTPKHAKPDKQSDTDTTTKDKTPKKEKPALNVVRDSANASTPKDEKTGPESGKKDKDETAAAASSTGADSAAASSNAA